MGRPASTVQTEPLYMDIDADLIARIRALAWSDGRTLRATIERLLQSALVRQIEDITAIQK